MPAQFEFHLRGADAPEGELEAGALIAVVQSLQGVALSLGRIGTDAARLGRAPARVHRVSTLVIGMAPGSTTIRARRAGAGTHALDLELSDEESFDSRVEELVSSIAANTRPAWVDDSLSIAAGQLVSTLGRAAPDVEFRVDGRTSQRFRTADLLGVTWDVAFLVQQESITFAGELFAANLKTHRFAVRDAVGHQVALPNVADDADVASLLGRQVIVTGLPELDADGALVHILDADIDAPVSPVASDVPSAVPLEDILRSAPGPDPVDGIDLTDDEFDAFLEAIRG